MSMPVASPAHRQRVLRALGVVLWQQRATKAAGPVAQQVVPSFPSSAVVVVVLPRGCSVRELDLLGRALCAFGPHLARAARIEVDDGMQVPSARAYLAFGQAQAQALGRALPPDVMRDAHIVLADTPDELLVQPASKRRLWHALRNLRRALAVPETP